MIFQKKVVPRIQTTSPKLRKLLLVGLEDVVVETDKGLQELCKWEFTREVFDKVKEFLVRMSKGLIRHYYPNLDYCNAEFVVRYVDDAKKLLEMKPLLDQLTYDERGEGVFRFGRGITPRGCTGFWIYTFYDVTRFIVFYSDQHPRPWQKQA